MVIRALTVLRITIWTYVTLSACTVNKDLFLGETKMFNRIFIPEKLYERWPYICLTIASVSFMAEYNVLGALLLGYAVGVLLKRLSF
jgi:hypothetical protein